MSKKFDKWHPSRSELLNWLSYDGDKGLLHWRNAPQPNTKRLQGKVAGTIDRNGYVIITLFKKGFKAHRIIWFLETGEWPTGVIDHLNGDTVDNRIVNLKDCSHTDNTRNTYRHRNGKLVGVGFHKRHQRWRAYTVLNGKQKNIGYFNTESEAGEAYKEFMNGQS